MVPEYSLLENAIAVELDGMAYRSKPDTTYTNQSGIFFDDTPLCAVKNSGNYTGSRYAHIAITRPDYANNLGTDPQKIVHYFPPGRKDISANPHNQIAKNSVVNVKWELTGQVNGENEYTLTANYYHNKKTVTEADTPTLTVSHKFRYNKTFGSSGLFGGTEEVYVGFSAGRNEEKSNNYTTVNLVSKTRYEVHHVSGGPPFPDPYNPNPNPAYESRKLAPKEDRYALLNSKINLTERKKTLNDYIFDGAYLADGTPITDISYVDFTSSDQIYYMSYSNIEKIIEDPTGLSPPAGYKRIIFNPTWDGEIINTGMLGMPKQFDVHETLTDGVEFPIVLGADEYFVLGDNRDKTTDSRLFGPLAKSDLYGKVFSLIRKRNI